MKKWPGVWSPGKREHTKNQAHTKRIVVYENDDTGPCQVLVLADWRGSWVPYGRPGYLIQFSTAHELLGARLHPDKAKAWGSHRITQMAWCQYDVSTNRISCWIAIAFFGSCTEVQLQRWTGALSKKTRWKNCFVSLAKFAISGWFRWTHSLD